jgi:hypothetical protein
MGKDDRAHCAIRFKYRAEFTASGKNLPGKKAKVAHYSNPVMGGLDPPTHLARVRAR